MKNNLELGTVKIQVAVTDTEALLSPRIMARIVAATVAHISERADQEKARLTEISIGQNSTSRRQR